MNYKKENIILILVFVLSFVLLFYGQTKIGYFGLSLQMLGLAGLLFDLYKYNRRFK
ncbi:MAG: hypothetical protein WBO70_00540 [Erysipelotrichaceae bacterium]